MDEASVLQELLFKRFFCSTRERFDLLYGCGVPERVLGSLDLEGSPSSAAISASRQMVQFFRVMSVEEVIEKIKLTPECYPE